MYCFQITLLNSTQFVAHGCALSSVNASVCDDLASQMDDLTADTDPYALDFPVCKDASASAGRDERVALMRKLEQAKHQDERKNLQGYQGTLLTGTNVLAY